MRKYDEMNLRLRRRKFANVSLDVRHSTFLSVRHRDQRQPEKREREASPFFLHVGGTSKRRLPFYG